MGKNEDLKEKYNQMHTEGQAAWFDPGTEERQAILKIGQPWTGKNVLEIGCGEGDLLAFIHLEQGWKPEYKGRMVGIDYSATAIKTAKKELKDEPEIEFFNTDWRDFNGECDILVMQGVMEHLDDPFTELAEMIHRFRPKTVITSMPGFLNIRGIIWHTLDMLAAVMSKTDLHFIDPWQVRQFCEDKGYRYRRNSIDQSWAGGKKMMDDLSERIPLALKDGNIICEQGRFDEFMIWLDKVLEYFDPDEGAINIYRIDI